MVIIILYHIKIYCNYLPTYKKMNGVPTSKILTPKRGITSKLIQIIKKSGQLNFFSNVALD